ncbi:hypothetical protein NE237_019758 [Protea cynaroides]|uniref:Uncharacterized protein n=1 Tax=Protea cynaroides TaxID=273540 RepID=A0A9Q0H5C4_9MAGN|nr:hypothetical protein NE237_019758 [Protea cynaroides]
MVTRDRNLGRSGGVYIPPFKLARMMKEMQDKSSIEYQRMTWDALRRMTWDALRKSINGLVNKPQLLAAVKFIAHLNAVHYFKTFHHRRGLCVIFERFRGILHEGEIDKRVHFLIEALFAIRKTKFQDYPAVHPELDLVEQEYQLTHEISLDDEIEAEISSDILKPDPNFLENEQRYEELKKNILGEESSEDEGGSEAGTDDEDDEESEEEEDEEETMEIKDETKMNLVNLRRTIYLTIMLSVDFEEAGHKLLKIKLGPCQEMLYCTSLSWSADRGTLFTGYTDGTISGESVTIRRSFHLRWSCASCCWNAAVKG